MLLPARHRAHLLVKYEGNDFRVKYQEPKDGTPTSATDGTLVDSNYKGDFWEFGGVPGGEVWVYQSTGGAVTISAREGFDNEIA
jgi:hypothetical protein